MGRAQVKKLTVTEKVYEMVMKAIAGYPEITALQAVEIFRGALV